MKLDAIAVLDELPGVLFPMERMLDNALLSATELFFPKQCAHVFFFFLSNVNITWQVDQYRQ